LAAYGNVEVREELEKRKVAVLAPVHSTSPKDGTVPKEAFAIDLETDTVTCPRQDRAPIYKPRPNRKRPIRPSAIGERVAKFSRSDCEPCPLRSAARRAGSGISESGAARICAKPRFGRYPIPPSATISSAPGR
jgi:hypothetical protein